MEKIPGWRSAEVSVVRSNGGTLALVDYRDNFLVPADSSWPPPEVAQKLFVSQKLAHFPEQEQAVLTARLGHYCDLQSIHSEDALTWNCFGQVGTSPLIHQTQFASRLLKHLGISDPILAARTWVWRRLPHPETLGGNGPELDFGIHAGHTLILGESKWHGAVSQGQGLGKDQNQIQIRMAFLRRSGRHMFPTVRRFIMLGVSIRGNLLEEQSCCENGVEFRQANLCWNDLTELVPQEDQQSFGAYLAWKVHYGRVHLSDDSLLAKLELKIPSRVCVSGATDAFLNAIGELPEGLQLAWEGSEPADTAMVFAQELGALDVHIEAALGNLRPGGKIWVCWPLRTSDLRSNIDKETVIEAGDRFGLVRMKAARVDRTWTGFKFFRRK